jgi:hypothetical protein
MTTLCTLWLPILLSSAAVFIISSIIHMFSPWHKSDYQPLPYEEKALDTLRSLSIPPGEYMFPRPASMKDMKSTEFKDKIRRGPIGIITLWKSGSMATSLIFWFLYSIVIGIFAAYITGHALNAGAAFLSVFRFIGATAFMGYSLGLWQMSIWYHRKLSTTLKASIDGLIYALVTAAIFGWLWP